MQPHHGAHFTSQIEVADFLKNTSTYSTFHRNLLLRKGLPLVFKVNGNSTFVKREPLVHGYGFILYSETVNL